MTTPNRPKHDHEKLARLLHDKVPVGEALLESGYSTQSARMGWKSVPKEVTRMLLNAGMRERHIGKALIEDKDHLESVIVGAMHDRMLHGKDGVPAAKVLTTHVSVSSKFVQEAQQNVVVIQAPSDWKPGHIEAIKAEAASKAVPQITELPELPEYE